MSDSILRDNSKELAKSIIYLCRELKKRSVEGALVNQLLRSGTSIGANLHEAQYAQGTKDFVSKLEIALKECNETDYWITIMFETDSLTNEEYSDFHGRCVSIRRMLVSSVNTLKEKL